MSEEKSKKKEESSNLMWFFLVIFFMALFFVIVGLIVLSEMKPKTVTETSNGFVFTKNGNFWDTSIENSYTRSIQAAEFRYSPSQVKDVIVNGDPRMFFKLFELNNLTAAYITFNFSEHVQNATLVAEELTAADVSHYLNSFNGITLVAGCMENSTDACSTRPIVTCENQKDKAIVIEVEESSYPMVTMDANCLTISGEGNDLVKAYDRLLFIWYGIL